MIWVALALAFVCGVLIVLLFKPQRPTGNPTDITRAVDQAMKQTASNVKEVIRASDDDISRRIDELRQRGRADK